MLHTIANPHLEVAISETGAELHSIKLDGEERLRRADPKRRSHLTSLYNHA